MKTTIDGVMEENEGGESGRTTDKWKMESREEDSAWPVRN